MLKLLYMNCSWKKETVLIISAFLWLLSNLSNAQIESARFVFLTYSRIAFKITGFEIIPKLTESEKKRIDLWIEKEGLNQYGDPKDTVYVGGTPLFDEKTGEKIDKYEYILRRHPDRPWNKYKYKRPKKRI